MGPVHQDDGVAPFIREAEKKKKIRAEKRLIAKLRKLEVEQKAILLAKAQKSLEKPPQIGIPATAPYDYAEPPSIYNYLLREEKSRNDLIALEREQKEDSYNELMEKRAEKNVVCNGRQLRRTCTKTSALTTSPSTGPAKRKSSKGILLRGSNSKSKGIE